MLQKAYFLAKIGADTAENEQHFAEILPTDARRRPAPAVAMYTDPFRGRPHKLVLCEGLHPKKNLALSSIGFSSNCLTRVRSLLAVSKPTFARKYALESSRRDLHNALLCTALESNPKKRGKPWGGKDPGPTVL